MVEDYSKVWRYHGQWDIFKPITNITIIGGAGSIGSTTALFIGKMGILKIEVWDGDKVEEHNIANQFYQNEDIGKFKVEALAHNLSQFTKTEVVVHNEYIAEATPLGDITNETIVISAFDSMAARKLLWEKAKFKAMIFIDGRMALEDGMVYTVNPRKKEDIEFYEATLIDDKDAYQERCTAKSIMAPVGVLASLIANNIKRVMNNEEYYREIVFNLGGLGWILNK